MKIKAETRTVFVGHEDLPCEIRAKSGWTSVFLGARRTKEGVINGGVPEKLIPMIEEAERERDRKQNPA